jgi:hypothetical protein
MPRDLNALDASPDGTRLVLGIDESRAARDGEVWIVDVAGLPDLLSPASPATARAPRLLQADWTPLFDALEAALDRQADRPDITELRLNIAPLQEALTRAEQGIRGADAEPDIIRQLEKRVRKQRRRADQILDDVAWLAHAMRLAGYHEKELEVTLASAASYLTGAILAALGTANCPDLEDIEPFVASTHGIEPDDVILLGFDTGDGRGMRAGVPVSFLINVAELARLGEQTLTDMGASHPSDREIVTAACARFHAFDIVFGWQDQRELWQRYVLPLAIAREPREQIIIKHSEIERFGLT